MNAPPDDSIGKYSRKEERLAVRLSAEAKRILAHAADVSGRSLSDFVVSSAMTAAHETIDQYERMRLTKEDRDVFLAAFSEPPEPNEALKAAVKRYRERTG